MKKTKRKYPIETETDHNYGPNKESTKFYKVPCGKRYPVQYWTKKGVIKEHCVKCKACDIILGYSKRKTLTQQQVANLFGLGIDDKQSSTGNFYSENGILKHYRTIEAIRQKDGTIIDNRECFNRGYAYCSTPRNVKYRLDLTTLGQFLTLDSMKEMEILDVDDNNTWFNTLLLRYKNRYFLNGSDERNRFIAELIEPCATVQEAYETMKHESVKKAEANGFEVKRQGELFFIPVSDALGKPHITGIQKRTRTPCKRGYYQCKKCGIKTETFITITEQTFYEDSQHEQTVKFRNTDDINRNKQHPYVSHWHATATEQQKECDGTNDDMKLIEYDSIEYGSFPSIPNHTQHTVTTLAKLFPYDVVKGIVRHSNGDHRALKLGDQWHVVKQNTVVRAVSVGTGGGD